MPAILPRARARPPEQLPRPASLWRTPARRRRPGVAGAPAAGGQRRRRPRSGGESGPRGRRRADASELRASSISTLHPPLSPTPPAGPDMAASTAPARRRARPSQRPVADTLSWAVVLPTGSPPVPRGRRAARRRAAVLRSVGNEACGGRQTRKRGRRRRQRGVPWRRLRWRRA
jgi:hypothetical protein